MAVDLTVLRPSTQDWAQEIGTADVEVAFGGSTRTLTGMDAVAYLFGQALSTVTYQNLLDGVQLSDGRFEFPPGSGDSVTLAELADALRYKYGVDPLIEFAPGLGLRGYSITDINNILERLNREFGGQFSFSLLDMDSVVTATEATWVTENAGSIWDDATKAATSALISSTSKAVLSSATEAELRQDLTEGGDVYVDRKGGFFINGVPTTAMDLTVTSRLLAQDNIGSEYKVIMDEYAERNNLIAASNVMNEAITSSEEATLAERNSRLLATIQNLGAQYGEDDMLSVLTAQKFTSLSLSPELAETVEVLPAYFDRLDIRMAGLEGLYTQALDAATIRKARYEAEGFTVNDAAYVNGQWFKRDLVSKVSATISKLEGWLDELREGRITVGTLSRSLDTGFATFEEVLGDTISTSGRADVFAWLNTFDIDPILLGEIPDQNLIGVDTSFYGFFGYHNTFYSGTVVDWDPDNVYDRSILLGENPDTDFTSPYGRFDWTLDDWGIWPNSDLYYPPDMQAAFRDAGYTVEANQTNPTLWHSEITRWNVSNLPDIWARQVFEGRLFSVKNDPFIGDLTNYDWWLPPGKSLKHSLPTQLWNYEPNADGYMDTSPWGFFDWNRWKDTQVDASTYSDALFVNKNVLTPEDFSEITALLNTLISNKVRDGELDQAKLQTLTAQLQNNTEAMTALIKVFKDLHAGLSQALR